MIRSAWVTTLEVKRNLVVNVTNTILAAIVAIGSASTTSNAATVVSGNVCEGGAPIASGSPCNPGSGDFDLGDFNTAIGNPTLELVGDTHIFGGVVHAKDSETKYFDNWTIDFGTDVYSAVFNYEITKAPFDARIVVGGTMTGNKTVNVGSGTQYTFSGALGDTDTIELGNLTGSVAFIIDPIFSLSDPAITTSEVMTWDMKLTQVPLPAGGVLLLTALGALGVARRRQSRA